MNNFDNKLNPLPIALSIISTLVSDNFLQVILEAGISIDLTLTKEENFSNKTRVRTYLLRVNEFIMNLPDELALNTIYLLVNALIIQDPQKKDKIIEKLRNIGWDLVANTLSPVDSDIIELFFEKGLVHSAYQKIRDIVQTTTSKIYIVDPYIDQTIFEFFKIFMENKIDIQLLTLKLKGDYSHEKKLFLDQYPNLTINEKTTEDVHDRFIIVDNKEVYHIGASIKDAGKKVFMINKIEDLKISQSIISSFKSKWEEG
ncbi:MAG: hypothetical protein WC680_07125 [Sulfuricurvum sp.]|jgi:hypothetical protein